MHRTNLHLPHRKKYFAALKAEKGADEIVAVEMMNDRLITWFSKDEHPRDTSLEKLGRLKPAFEKDGTVKPAIHLVSMMGPLPCCWRVKMQ